MPMEVFRKALAASENHDSMITIGGGEPTLHPDLLAMLGIASFLTSDPLFMVTNGTCSRKMWHDLMVARENNRLDIHVSNDLWHDTDMIRDWVWEDADRHRLWWGDPSMKHRTLVRRGRARRNWSKLMWECHNSGIEVRAEESDCSEPRVAPDGRVWADVPGGGAMGMVDDPKAIGRAYDAIQRYEDKGEER